MIRFRKILRNTRLVFTNSIFVLSSFVFIRPLLFFTGKRELSAAATVICIDSMFLGDLILASDFFHGLSGSGKFKHHYLVVREEYGALCKVLFPDWEIIPLNSRRYKYDPFYRLRLLIKIKQLGATLAINVSSERGVINDELTALCHARQRVTHHSQGEFLFPFFRSLNNSFYTTLLQSGTKSEHARLLELFPLIEVNPDMTKSLKYMHTMDKTTQHFQEWNAPFIVVAPLALHGDKSWSAANYKRLCERLSEIVPVIIIGSKEQKVQLAQFENGTTIKSAAGSVSLAELPDLLIRSSLFIGNDSGTTHLAHALNVPVIAIVGGGSWGRFFPYGQTENIKYFFHEMDCFGCNWMCIHDNRYCLTDIRVDDVMKHAETMLRRHTGQE